MGNDYIEEVNMALRIFLADGIGLVGHMVATRLAAREDVQLTVPARLGRNGIDYEKLCAEPSAELHRLLPGGVDVAISCLGTTIARAGSQAAMRRVDHDYVLAVA